MPTCSHTYSIATMPMCFVRGVGLMDMALEACYSPYWVKDGEGGGRYVSFCGNFCLDTCAMAAMLGTEKCYMITKGGHHCPIGTSTKEECVGSNGNLKCPAHQFQKDGRILWCVCVRTTTGGALLRHVLPTHPLRTV